MGFLKRNLDAVPDLRAVADGEYLLKIARAELIARKPKEGEAVSPGDMLRIRFKIVGEPTAFPVLDWLCIGNENMDPEMADNFDRALKYFQDCFKVKLQELDSPDQLVGHEGSALLQETPAPTPEGTRNVVAKYLVPR